jgi:hypothetical protein
MNKGNGRCPLCNNEIEDQILLLYTCQNIQPIVNKLKEKTEEIKNKLQIDAENILGYHDILRTGLISSG